MKYTRLKNETARNVNFAEDFMSLFLIKKDSFPSFEASTSTTKVRFLLI